MDLLLLLLSVLNLVRGEGNRTLHMGVLVPWSGVVNLGPELSCAFVLGIRTVEERGLLPGYRIKYDMKDGRCNNREGMKAAVDLWSNMDGLDVIIGDACSVVCQPVALLAAAWNIPQISNACTSDALTDTKEYPTFSRSVGNYKQFIPVLARIAQTFNWTKLAVVTEMADLFKVLADLSKSHLESIGIKVLFKTFVSTVNVDKLIWPNLVALRNIVRELQEETRVVILLMYAADSRNFLILSHEEGMLNRDYAFYGVDIIPAFEDHPVLRPDLSDAFLYQGFMNVDGSVDLPSNWSEFQGECLQQYILPIFRPFSVPCNSSEITYRAGNAYILIFISCPL